MLEKYYNNVTQILHYKDILHKSLYCVFFYKFFKQLLYIVEYEKWIIQDYNSMLINYFIIRNCFYIQ